MADFIYLMHNDEISPASGTADDGWYVYIEKLKANGCFRGGSEVGHGKCVRKELEAPEIYQRLVGYICIEAASLAEAEAKLEGNPVYEAGGTVEIRELPRSS